MNKRLLKNICFDVILWSALYVAVFMQGSVFYKYAENALSFGGVFFGVAGILTCCFVSDVYIKDRVNNSYNPKSNFHKTYANITTITEVLIFASLGWYWVAGCWLIGFAANERVNSDCDKLYKSKVIEK